MTEQNPGAVAGGALPRLEPLRSIGTDVLEVAYFEAGPSDGEVIPQLAEAGHRVIVPYLRAHGPTRFLDSGTPRSGQQASIGGDVIALPAALAIPRAILAGFGRAGLTASRREIARVIWTRNSPRWQFDDAMLERAATAFDNSDYVDVVLHSYRHRLGLAAGFPAYDEVEQRLRHSPRSRSRPSRWTARRMATSPRPMAARTRVTSPAPTRVTR